MKRQRANDVMQIVNQQAASALLQAVFRLLVRNGISRDWVADYALAVCQSPRSRPSTKRLREIAYKHSLMARILSTWYSDPSFVDSDGCPIPLSVGRGANSIASLIKASHSRMASRAAVDLFLRSSSARMNADNQLVPLQRVFMIPGFELVRTTLVIERYLDTIASISKSKTGESVLLLERNCYTRRIHLARIAPLLRDIKEQGTAFLDSIDGKIEMHRNRQNSKSSVGEIGAFVFSWAKTAERNSKRKGKGRRAGKIISRKRAT